MSPVDTYAIDWKSVLNEWSGRKSDIPKTRTETPDPFSGSEHTSIFADDDEDHILNVLVISLRCWWSINLISAKARQQK